jgi:hypothetical protein
MRRLIARRSLALVAAGLLLAFGAFDFSPARDARSAVSNRLSSIASASERSALDVTETIHEPEPAAVGRNLSESSRPPVGYVALATVVAAAFAARLLAGRGRARSVLSPVSWLRSRAPPALSLI